MVSKICTNSIYICFMWIIIHTIITSTPTVISIFIQSIDLLLLNTNVFEICITTILCSFSYIGLKLGFNKL